VFGEELRAEAGKGQRRRTWRRRTLGRRGMEGIVGGEEDRAG
jgi:hypothetical protein